MQEGIDYEEFLHLQHLISMYEALSPTGQQFARQWIQNQHAHEHWFKTGQVLHFPR